MARPSTAKALAVVLGIILVPTVFLYLLILTLTRSSQQDTSAWGELWNVRKASGSMEGSAFLAGHRAFFFDTGDRGTVLMEVDLKDGKAVPSPGIPQSLSFGDTGLLAVEGKSLFFYQKTLGLYQRSPGDVAWKLAAPALALPEGTELLSLEEFEDAAYLVGSKTQETAVELSVWRQKDGGWEDLPSWKGSKPHDHGLVNVGLNRIGDVLYIFVSACPSGGSCGPRSDHHPEQTLVLYSLGSRRWTKTPSSWTPDAITATAASKESYLLLGGSRFYRYDREKGAAAAVDSLSRIFKASTYEPHLGVGGDVAYIGAGDQIYFFDDDLGRLVDPLAKGPEGEPPFSYYYDTADRNRVLVRGDKALIQVQNVRSENYESIRSGLGYFEKKDGRWAQVGFLQDFVMVQPLDLSERGLLYAKDMSLALLPFGLNNCRVSAGSGSWRDGVVHGRVSWSAPDFCRFELEFSPAYGGRKRKEIVTISGDASKPFLENFSRLQAGDLVTVGLLRRNRSWASDRVFVDSREGRPVPGQVPIRRAGPAWLGAILTLLLGLGSLVWGIRSLSRNGVEAFRRMFPDEVRASSANRLRTTGFALLGLALFCLIQRIGGRPYDLVEVLEGTSLRLGIFLLGFAGIYYAGAINLLTHLRRSPCPQRP